jgi:RNA recognition motif-containing protein
MRTKKVMKKNVTNKTPPRLMGSDKNSTLYLGNLRYDKSEDGIKTMLSRYGKPKWVKIVADPVTKLNKGIAFAEMSSPEEAIKAVRGMDGKVVEGRTLKVSIALSKQGYQDKGEIREQIREEKKERIIKKEKKMSQKVKKKSGLEVLFDFLKTKKSK